MQQLFMSWHSRQRIAIIIALCTVVALVLAAGTSSRLAAQSPNERVVSVYDGDSQLTFVTTAKTVREALDKAQTKLTPSDAVEPALDTKLVASNYNVNVYRARPVLVVDGEKRQTVLSPYKSARQIAEKAGLSMYPEDTATVERVDDVLTDGAAAQKVVITRAVPLTLELYGKATQIRTQAKTVGELMKEKGVVLGSQDGASQPADQAIAAGMTIRIWRNGVQTVTQEEAVPAPVRTIHDADKALGFQEIQTPGKPGKKTVTYEINMQNGQEVSRKEIQSVVTEQPTEQVVVVGDKIMLPAGSHEDWMAAAGISASDYGYVNYIVSHEGGWEPCKVQGGAINCSYDGPMGYGLVQSTPGYKMGSAGADWRTNPITQLRWASSYATGRYGSWGAAYQHWLSSHNW